MLSHRKHLLLPSPPPKYIATLTAMAPPLAAFPTNAFQLRPALGATFVAVFFGHLLVAISLNNAWNSLTGSIASPAE